MSKTEAAPILHGALQEGARFGIAVPVRMMPTELPGAIESVLSQTIGGRQVNTGGQRDVNLIVVVDDIDPETRRVLDSYADRIAWVEGDKRFQSGAVVKGLELVGGEIVKFLNADDRLLPGALEAMDAAFEDAPEVDFVYGDIVFHDGEGRAVGGHREPGYSRFILLYGHNLFADPACFWRRRLHDKIGPISTSTKYSLDYEFWVRLVKHRISVGQVRQDVAAFKVTGDNLSVVHHKAMRREHFDAVAQHFGFWGALPTGLRNRALAGLLLVARVLKKLRVQRQRGAQERGVFPRLMSASPPGSDTPAGAVRRIKPVVTLDQARLRADMKRLWDRAQAGEQAPDAIVGVATGGLVCARLLEDDVEVEIFSVAMRRASSATKEAMGVSRILHRLPYGLTNWLRRLEDGLLARRAARAPTPVPAPTPALTQDVAEIARAVQERGLRHLLVIDDAVDSGATLACVLNSLTEALGPDVTLSSAVVTQTRAATLCTPDIALYHGTLCRFPWSHDFKKPR